MRYASKEFLSSSPDEAGSIICSIKTRQVKDLNEYNVKHGYITADIRIADCSEHVILDFNAEGPKAYTKRLSKLDKLIEELQNMRTQYVAMWDNHQRDIKFYKEKEGIKDERPKTLAQGTNWSLQ